jgi:hypothetical protein
MSVDDLVMFIEGTVDAKEESVVEEVKQPTDLPVEKAKRKRRPRKRKKKDQQLTPGDSPSKLPELQTSLSTPDASTAPSRPTVSDEEPNVEEETDLDKEVEEFMKKLDEGR